MYHRWLFCHSMQRSPTAAVQNSRLSFFLSCGPKQRRTQPNWLSDLGSRVIGWIQVLIYQDWKKSINDWLIFGKAVIQLCERCNFCFHFCQIVQKQLLDKASFDRLLGLVAYFLITHLQIIIKSCLCMLVSYRKPKMWRFYETSQYTRQACTKI